MASLLSIRLLGAAALSLSALPALAEIVISDSYARYMPGSQFGAVFMEIENTGETADRLVSATTDMAARVELHTHIEDEDGVFRMREVEGGFEIPPGETRLLARGGDHVMLMGVDAELSEVESVALTLTFEQAGEVEISAEIDNERMPMQNDGMMDGHGDHGMDHQGE